MPGCILQLVTNTNDIQNIKQDGDPQITYFKKVFRKGSCSSFAMEIIPNKLENFPDFGQRLGFISNDDVIGLLDMNLD